VAALPRNPPRGLAGRSSTRGGWHTPAWRGSAGEWSAGREWRPGRKDPLETRLEPLPKGGQKPFAISVGERPDSRPFSSATPPRPSLWFLARRIIIPPERGFPEKLSQQQAVAGFGGNSRAPPRAGREGTLPRLRQQFVTTPRGYQVKAAWRWQHVLMCGLKVVGSVRQGRRKFAYFYSRLRGGPCGVVDTSDVPLAIYQTASSSAWLRTLRSLLTHKHRARASVCSPGKRSSNRGSSRGPRQAIEMV
jgi:hypothetical protein